MRIVERSQNGLSSEPTRGRTLAQGRTFGGIQLAEYVFPTAFNLGYLNPGPGFCRNGGHHRFYTEAELAALYPDTNAYVRDVAETTKANLAAGYITCDDAAETITAAYRLFGQNRPGKMALCRDGTLNDDGG